MLQFMVEILMKKLEGKMFKVMHHYMGLLVDDYIKTYNERSIIFCLDISGSMGTWFNDNYSRLNIVKAMIIKNITEINKNNPNYKVGLVTFGSIIYYYGDGECNIFINEIIMFIECLNQLFLFFHR